MPKPVDKYEFELTKVLDVHAPVRKRKITVRPSAAWYSDDIDRKKTEKTEIKSSYKQRVLQESMTSRQTSSLMRKAKKNYCTTPKSCKKIMATRIRPCLTRLARLFTGKRDVLPKS